MTPIDSPTHATAFPQSISLRRITLALGLLLVEWSARSAAQSPTDDADQAAAARRAHAITQMHTDHETLIRRHHTHRALEQERQRAEARMLTAPLAW